MGTSVSPCFTAKVREISSATSKLAQDNYPESLAAAYVINAPGRAFHSSTSHLNLSHFCHYNPATAQRIPQRVLTSGRKVDECKPLATGIFSVIWAVVKQFLDPRTVAKAGAYTRPLLSST